MYLALLRLRPSLALYVWLLASGTALAQQSTVGNRPATNLLAPAIPANPPTIPGQLVFRLRPQFQPGATGATPTVPALTVALQTLGATSLRPKFPHSPAPTVPRRGSPNLHLLYQVTVPPTVALEKARTLLLSTGAVEYVEPLYIRQPQYQPNDPRADSTAANNQYYLKNIRAYRAWDIYKGDSTIVIGLTDGGARLTHEDLRHQVARNYADRIDGLDNDGDGYVDNFQGWDLANDDNDAGFNANSGSGIITVHGSQVAGIMSGEPDNGKGVAGVGFRCRFMPLNIYANTPTGQFAGYEAIVYAADHGCQVVNMSWGAPGGYSRFEQDVITYAAVERNVVLVAAAGNTNANIRYYPASYDHVISVTGVDAQDKKLNDTYNREVDLTVPGANLWTTYGNVRNDSRGPIDADYEAVGSTSFAAPQVAGAAALVRGRFPTYTADQVAAQLRQTADNIDALPGNVAYAGFIGTGRLNMARALTETNGREARVVRSRFTPARSSYAKGEQIQLSIKLLNLLGALENAQVTLTSLSPYLTVSQGEFSAGNLATLDSTNNLTTPFRLSVTNQDIPLNTTATLRYHITAANGYQSDDYVTVQLNPDYVTLDAGDLSLTLTSRGNLGYDDVTATFGDGASYKKGTPLLSEGGLLLATSPIRVSDRLRGAPAGTIRKSFFSLSQARRVVSGPRADQEAFVLFQDSLPALDRNLSLGVQVRLHGRSWAAAPRRDFVLLEYTLKNVSPDPLDPLLAGLFMDWDLPGEAARNAAVWDSVRFMGYCYDVGAPRQYAGVRLLSGGAPATYAINNGAPAGTQVYFRDGFSRAEKYLTLSNGTARATRKAGLPNGADVSQVVGANLGRVADGDSVTVVFAVLAAGSLPQLEAAADAAQAAYTQILLPVRPAVGASAWRVYPNPTVGLLHLEVPAAFGASEARVTDALGRLVLRQAVAGTTFEVSLRGLAPGPYTVRVVGTDGRSLSRLILLR